MYTKCQIHQFFTLITIAFSSIYVCPFNVFGDDLSPPHTISIKTGPKKEHLGRSTDGMVPMFFAVDKYENIYIPDPERNRIAIYDSQGIFLKSINRIEALSHRMNYFDITPDGSFIVYSDSTMYLLNNKGKILWDIPFPLGFLPSDIAIISSSVFLQFVVNNEKTIVVEIPCKDPETISYTEFLTDMPIYLANENKQFSWSNRERTGDNNVITYPDGSRYSKFLDVFSDGYSIWFDAYGKKSSIVILSDELEIISIYDISSLSLDDGKWHQLRFVRNGSEISIFDLTTYNTSIEIRKLKLFGLDSKPEV